MELAPSLHSLHGAGSTEVIAIPIFAQPAPLAGMLAGVLATRVRTVSLTIDSPRVRKKKPAAMAALTPRARTAHDAPSLQRIQPKEKPKRRQQRRRRPKKEEEISERSVQENAPEENRIFRPLVLHHFHSAADILAHGVVLLAAGNDLTLGGWNPHIGRREFGERPGFVFDRLANRPCPHFAGNRNERSHLRDGWWVASCFLPPDATSRAICVYLPSPVLRPKRQASRNQIDYPAGASVPPTIHSNT